MSTMPKKAFLPKNVEWGLRRWHKDAKRRLKLQVLEKYHNQRMARRSEGAITPLDECYFLQGSTDSVLTITDGPHWSRSTPLTLIMEVGSLSDIQRTSTTNSRSMVAVEAAAPNQAQSQDHASDSIQRRVSPRSAMDLNIPPFQPRGSVHYYSQTAFATEFYNKIDSAPGALLPVKLVYL